MRVKGRRNANVVGRRGRERTKTTQSNTAIGECPFFFLQQSVCFYNHLHENTYYVVHLDHDSEHVPFGE